MKASTKGVLLFVGLLFGILLFQIFSFGGTASASGTCKNLSDFVNPEREYGLFPETVLNKTLEVRQGEVLIIWASEVGFEMDGQYITHVRVYNDPTKNKGFVGLFHNDSSLSYKVTFDKLREGAYIIGKRAPGFWFSYNSFLNELISEVISFDNPNPLLQWVVGIYDRGNNIFTIWVPLVRKP
jgi:hypothetical protein